jgi:hypothetical protein
VAKPEGKRPLGRHGRRRENNIKMDLRVMGWSGTVFSHPYQDRDQWRALVNKVMNFEKFLSSSPTGRFARRTHVRGVSLV